MRKKPMLTLLSTAVITAVAALSVPTTVVIAAPAKAAAAGKFTNKAYIVRLAEQPVVAYDGGIKGLQATRPGKGQKIDPNSPAVVNYRSFLESRQDAVLASVGGGKKLYSYGYVFNGFAAELTAAQAEKLAATPGVLAVEKDDGASARHVVDPDFPWPECAGWPLGPDGGVGNAARTSSSASSTAALAGDPSFSRPHRHERQRHAGTASSSTSRFPAGTAGACPVSSFNASQLQPEADRRALLQRRLGRQRRHRRAAALGIQLAARLRRPRHAHRHDGWRQRQRADHRRSRGIRQHQRHRAARAHRGLQGLLGNRRGRQLLQLPTAWRPSTRPLPTAWT